MRAGKETYAVIAATLRAFATAKHEERIPIYRMLATPVEVLRTRAEHAPARHPLPHRRQPLRPRRRHHADRDHRLRSPSKSPATPPRSTTRFLRNDPPIVGRIQDDRFTIDVRTLLETDLTNLGAALRAGS